MLSLILFLSVGPGPSSDAGTAMTLSDVATLHRAHRDRLQALSVIYIQTGGTTTEGVAKGFIRRELTTRQGSYLLRDNSHGHADLNWTADPARKILFARPSDSGLLENLNRVYRPLTGPEQWFDDAEAELLFNAIGWWPFISLADGRECRPLRSMMLFGDERQLTLMDQPETLDERICRVIVAQHGERLWIDEKNPLQVLRRDIVDPETGTLRSRYDMDQYREFDKHLWIPTSIRNQQYDWQAELPSERERLIIDAAFRLRSVKLNDECPSAELSLPFEPGTVILTGVDGQIQLAPIRPGQLHHFQSIAAWSRGVVLSQQRTESANGWLTVFSAVIAGTAAGICMLWISFRSRNSTNAEQPVK